MDMKGMKEPSAPGFTDVGGASAMEAPPSYDEVMSAKWHMSYVDFSPRCSGRGSALTSPSYASFDSVVEEANMWLAQHPDVKVKICETVDNKHKSGRGMNMDKTSYTVHGEDRTYFVRALRLYIVPQTGSHEVQKIGYATHVPEQVPGKGTEDTAGMFEDFDTTVKKFNQKLQYNGQLIPGKILNVETKKIKYSPKKPIDTDKTTWTNIGDDTRYFLGVIRVFYLHTPEPVDMQEIAYKDFVPETDDLYDESSLPTFYETMEKAKAWLQVQSGIHFFNLQAVEYKYKRGSPIDAQRSLHGESNTLDTKYIHILRLYYTHACQVYPELIPAGLTYETFQPKMKSGLSIKFDSMTETMKLAMGWIQEQRDLRFLCAETFRVPLKVKDNFPMHEHAVHKVKGDEDQLWLLVLRIYAQRK